MCTCYRCTLLCLSGLQIHTQCCVYLDYTHTLLSPAGSQIHTSVSGWIADTHYCVWLYSGLGIQAQFLVLVNQMFYPWNKPFSYSQGHNSQNNLFMSFNERGPERPAGNFKMKCSTEFPNTTSQSMDEAFTSGKTMATVGAEGASSIQHNGVHIFKGGDKSLSLSDHILQINRLCKAPQGYDLSQLPLCYPPRCPTFSPPSRVHL